VFQVLLLEECAAQLLRSQEEGMVAISQQAVVSQVRHQQTLWKRKRRHRNNAVFSCVEQPRLCVCKRPS
jgi:hypothetical protein